MFLGRLWPPYVDGDRVQAVLDVRGVVLLNHFHAGATILGDLIDVRPLTEADVGVPQAVERSPLTVSAELQFLLFEDCIEKLVVRLRKYPVIGCGLLRFASRRKGSTAPVVLL